MLSAAAEYHPAVVKLPCGRARFSGGVVIPTAHVNELTTLVFANYDPHQLGFGDPPFGDDDGVFFRCLDVNHFDGLSYCTSGI